MSQRSVLLVCRSAPYGSSRARDALDATLAFGAFEMPVKLLLLGDGVLMLASDVESGSPLSRLAGTLPDYGIERVFVERSSLAERGLGADSLAVPVEALDDDALAALIAAHELVLTV